MTGSKARVARALALAFLAGDWTVDALAQRGADVVAMSAALLRPLARLALRTFPAAPVGRFTALADVLARSRALRSLLAQHRDARVRRWILPEPHMANPSARLAGLPIPTLASATDVARFVGLPLEELDWFADPRRLHRSTVEPKLQHYTYRWVRKRSGAYRLLEAPKLRLKQAQRTILDGILAHVPLHDACHGHRRARSVRTFVEPHAGKPVVTRPAPTSPEEARDASWARQRLRDAHLAQGAPTSPALANLAGYRLDARLAALADRFGATYGRYADDLAFSGPERFHSALGTFVPIVGAIAIEEGFALRFHKTRVMSQAVPQRLCGVIVNDVPSLSRRELERLEAILHNCRRYGPASQNRDAVPDFRAHLTGRVAWARHLHPRKGERLLVMLEAIDWDGGGVDAARSERRHPPRDGRIT